MMMYNPETSEIAKPTELLNSVKSIMTVLQGIENYGNQKYNNKIKAKYPVIFVPVVVFAHVFLYF